ncbi:MAG: hypothetical protein KGQ88_01310, partial [Chloroflexi bacterium]|nr:hypothetical protein [Chloroflexota bacterium]
MTIVVAVVPFGAVVDGEGAGTAGQWARQIARRVVDRFAGHDRLELRPVFLVAMPEAASDAGYLVFGSTPDPALAAEYARSLEASFVLTGTYREVGGRRSLDASLVDVASGEAASTFARDVARGELHRAEPALAAWLASSLGADPPPGVERPAAANEEAYASILEGMDHE